MRGAAAKKCLVSACVAITTISCAKAPRGAEERQREENVIARAVVEDLLRLPPDPHLPGEVRDASCIFFGADAQGDYRDPPRRLLGLLGAEQANVYPASECLMGTRGLIHRRSGAKAQFLGVYAVEWKRDDFVKVEGERMVGPLAGASWIYSLSLTEKGWVIDTVQKHKIY